MDGELIKIIIVIGITVISMIWSAAKKKKEEDKTNAPSHSPCPPQPNRRHQMPMAQQPMRPQHIQQPVQPPMQRQMQQPVQQMPTMQQPKPQRQAPPAKLPDEGVRVTAKRIAPPMAANESRRNRESVFKTKDDIRRAIILGEALAPKF